jgi:hypothetical protein
MMSHVRRVSQNINEKTEKGTFSNDVVYLGVELG